MGYFSSIIQPLCIFLLVFGIFTNYSQAQNLDSLPLFQASEFQFIGAFRVPASDFGNSDLNYSQGPLEYNPGNNSIFIVGHAHQQAIAEFPVPSLVNSTVLTDLNMAASPLQVFSSILDRPTSGNTQNIDRIGGMRQISGELIVNVYEYYDAPGDNTHSTLVIRNSNAIATSQVEGYFSFQGVAAHTSGWISPIPLDLQSFLGGDYITGHSSGVPIISRLSVGPSAFAFSSSNIVGNSSVPNPIPNTKLLDFSLDYPLHSDLSNSSLTNDIWTHLSRIVYGFIAPGTRTYVTLGYTGGHASGVCYKCTQNNGNLCGGYCAPDAGDYSTYYWLWDLNDLLAVKNGTMNSYDVRPYSYGDFQAPFSVTQIGGGSFDPNTGNLYITLQRADRAQGTYANPPVIAVYKFNEDASPANTPSAPFNLRRK